MAIRSITKSWTADLYLHSDAMEGVNEEINKWVKSLEPHKSVQIQDTVVSNGSPGAPSVIRTVTVRHKV